MSLRARRMICHQFPRIKKIFPLDSVGDKNLMKYDEDPNTTLCEFCAFPRCILTLTRSSAGLLSVIHHRGPFPPPAQFEPPSIHEHPPLSVSGTNRTNSPALLYSAPSSHDSLFVIVHFVFHHLVPVVEPSSNSQQLVRGLGPSVSMTSRPVSISLASNRVSIPCSLSVFYSILMHVSLHLTRQRFFRALGYSIDDRYVSRQREPECWTEL